MSQHNPTDEVLQEHPPDEPIIIVGEPKHLRGELHLRNTGAEKIVLRGASVSGARMKTATAEAAEATDALEMTKTTDALRGQVALSATIQPGQSQHVSLTLDLGQHTPPGEYHGELEVAGRTRPLVMHVTEVVRLKISPKQIVIDQRAGARVSKRVIFSNEGNIPLTIGEIGDLMLGEELLLCLGLRASIATVNDKSKSLEELFTEIIRDEAKTILRQVGSLHVHNPAAPLVLAPGEVRPVDLEIQLPENLETNSRYRGRLPLYTADLEFVIVPVSDESKLSAIEPAAN